MPAADGFDQDTELAAGGGWQRAPEQLFAFAAALQVMQFVASWLPGALRIEHRYVGGHSAMTSVANRDEISTVMATPRP